MASTSSKKPIWEKKNPKKKSKPLTEQQRAKAKRAAKRHGRSTPSLVDNINAQKSSKKKKSTKE